MRGRGGEGEGSAHGGWGPGDSSTPSAPPSAPSLQFTSIRLPSSAERATDLPLPLPFPLPPLVPLPPLLPLPLPLPPPPLVPRSSGRAAGKAPPDASPPSASAIGPSSETARLRTRMEEGARAVTHVWRGGAAIGPSYPRSRTRITFLSGTTMYVSPTTDLDLDHIPLWQDSDLLPPSFRFDIPILRSDPDPDPDPI